MQLSYIHIRNKNSWSIIRFHMKIFYNRDTGTVWFEYSLYRVFHERSALI